MAIFTLIAAGWTFIIGSLNHLFGWNLALKIGGSVMGTPPDDFVGLIITTLALAIIAGVFWVLGNLRRSLQLLRQYRWFVLAALVVLTAATIIGIRLTAPNLALELAVQEGNSTKAQTLLAKHDYSPEVLEELLYWSLQNEDYVVSQTLLDQGADINHLRGEFQGTLLHNTVHFFSPSVLKFLLEKGADANVQDTLGRTALHSLIGYRARITDGTTTETEILAMAEILVSHGANLALQDQAGKTPLDLAQAEQYTQVARFLEQQTQD